jgi:hypothetical protein
VTAPRLSAIDALARGFANVRANRELVLVQVAAGVLLAASILVPMLFFIVRLGVPLRTLSATNPQAIAEALANIEPDLGRLFSLLGMGLLVMLVVGTLVFILYCWFQAGTLAVLLAGEAQAPAMRGVPHEVFRTFSWPGFVGWASRYGLRIFWINNLFLLFMTLLLLVLALPFLLAAGLSDGEFSPVGCVVGCGLALPVGFVGLVFVLAMMVAQICAVEEGATTMGATRRAFTITGRRLGGLLLLYLLMMAGSVAVSTFFGVVGVVLKLLLAHVDLLRTVLSAGLGVVELVCSILLTLVLTAAMVALVRAEMRTTPGAPRFAS